MSMRLILSIVLLAASLGAAEETSEKAAERAGRAAELLTEIMSAPDHAIPQDLLRRAHCVALIPGVKKVGLLVGAKYGKGVIACRTGAEGGWSGPSTVRLEGGSIGFQIGGSSTDVVLLVMNEEGVEKLRSSKFTLGADAAVAGGPVGRSAQAKPTPRCTPRFFPTRARAACSRAFRSRAPRYGPMRMTMKVSMAARSATRRS